MDQAEWLYSLTSNVLPMVFQLKTGLTPGSVDTKVFTDHYEPKTTDNTIRIGCRVNFGRMKMQGACTSMLVSVTSDEELICQMLSIRRDTLGLP